MDPDYLFPILGVRAGDLPDRFVVVGDPTRAEAVADRLTGAIELGRNREYATFAGSHLGRRVGVASHGVGAAGAGVCFEELCRGGAGVIIRAGTCGGMQDHILEGTLVVATGAVRAEGFTDKLVPLGFPAVADHGVTAALRAAAGLIGARYSTSPVFEGVVLTDSLFYPHGVLGSNLAMWQRAGVVAVEMEAAALFVISSLHGVRAGTILAVDGNPLVEKDDDMSGYDPHRQVVKEAVETMVEIALDALVGTP